MTRSYCVGTCEGRIDCNHGGDDACVMVVVSVQGVCVVWCDVRSKVTNIRAPLKSSVTVTIKSRECHAWTLLCCRRFCRRLTGLSSPSLQSPFAFVLRCIFTMASLLERMNVDTSSGVGPVRSKTRRAGSAPYTRPPKADINSPWKHDMYQQGAERGKSLSDRLDAPSREAPPKMNFGSAVKALKEATGLSADKELSIRGASTRGNVVEVTGLVKGTTAEDVEVSNSKIAFSVIRRVG